MHLLGVAGEGLLEVALKFVAHRAARTLLGRRGQLRTCVRRARSGCVGEGEVRGSGGKNGARILTAYLPDMMACCTIQIGNVWYVIFQRYVITANRLRPAAASHGFSAHIPSGHAATRTRASSKQESEVRSPMAGVNPRRREGRAVTHYASARRPGASDLTWLHLPPLLRFRRAKLAIQTYHSPLQLLHVSDKKTWPRAMASKLVEPRIRFNGV